MPTAHVHDIDMYYGIHGKGEPLVMIQGLGFEIHGVRVSHVALRQQPMPV